MKMKFASVLLTVICLLGLSAAAKADIRGQIRVTLPFALVVDGETLPAGTYTLSTFSDDKFDGLILSNHDHRIGVFVHPVEIESASADKPQVEFPASWATAFPDQNSDRIQRLLTSPCLAQ